MSGNLDAPEGGFDAIMQVVACKVRIRILLVAVRYMAIAIAIKKIKISSLFQDKQTDIYVHYVYRVKRLHCCVTF